MKNIILTTITIISFLNFNFAHNGDTTSTKDAHETTTTNLVGEWAYTNFSYSIVDNIHYCDNLIIAKDAFVKFHFEENGTYTKTFGNGVEETIEIGKWNITEDAASIVLYEDGSSTEQFIKILNIENEKVELELNIESTGLSNLFCTKINVLNFSKNILPLKGSIFR